MSHSTRIYALLLLSILLVCCTQKNENIYPKLIGKWINTNSDFVEIRDTISNANYIGNHARMRGKYLKLRNDTLSFQDRYTSSEDNYATFRVDKAEFKIVSISDSFLSIRPISNLTTKIFDEEIIQLTRQKYSVDPNINFEKIIFHTSHCMGHCPVYHLEIDSHGTARLHKEIVYKKHKSNTYTIDSSQTGYYAGVLNPKLLKQLTHDIQTCNLENVEVDGIFCCDGSLITMIVYYNGKKKYLQDMFPPRILNTLINQLYMTCEEANLPRSRMKFELEKKPIPPSNWE